MKSQLRLLALVSLFAVLSSNLILLAHSAHAEEQELARLELFTPEGSATNVRQVRAVFSADMIAFADPRVRADIFSVDCRGGEDLPKGSARWADTKTWIYDFERDLPAGVHCRFKLSPLATTAKGSAIAATSEKEFSTGGPLVSRIMPWAGDSISEDQIFLLRLNGPAERGSVRKFAYFTTDSVENRIAAEIVDDDTRDELLESQYLSPQEKKEGTFIALRARQRFSTESSVTLVWGASIASPSGETSAADQQFSFTVRGPFDLSLNCERTKSDAPCIPFRPIQLNLSAGAKATVLQRARLTAPDGTEFSPKISDDDQGQEYIDRVEFKGPFPPNTTLTAQLPDNIRDEIGRELTLDQAAPITISVGDYPPLAKFAAPFGVIEWSDAAAIPVTVRDVGSELITRMLDDNDLARYAAGGVQSLPLRLARIKSVPEMQQWIRLLRWRSDHESLFERGEYDDSSRPSAIPSDIEEQRLPRPLGGKSFEVMGIPVRRPGFYLVEVESPRLAETYATSNGRFFVRTAALVTNLAPHFKWGKERSLAWITALNSGAPVEGAKVAVSDCTGKIYWQGTSDSQGLAYPTGLPGFQSALPSCGSVSGLYLTASVLTPAGEDFSFTSTSWTEGIEAWRFSLPVDYQESLWVAHSVFAESLLRRGKTVHYKTFLRTRSGVGLRLPKQSELPDVLTIRHLGSDEEVQRPITWKRNASAEGSWDIPLSAKLGSYSLTLSFDEKKHPGKSGIPAGSFDVEDFRLPLMQARVQPPSGIQVTPSTLPFSLAVSYLSGGTANNLPVVLRSAYQPLWVDLGEDYRSYSFLSGRVQEGVFRSGSEYGEGEDYSQQSSEQAKLPKDVARKELSLDRNGTGEIEVSPVASISIPYQVTTELEYRDPNGEVQTVQGSARVWPASVALGLKAENWTGERERVSVKAIALTPSGEPLPHQRIEITLFQSKNYSHRKRLVGGFYGYENTLERKLVGPLCAGETNEKGLFECSAPVAFSGEVLLEARTQDDQGRVAATSTSAWIAGEDNWWFAQEQSDRIDLLPEKKVYEIGETAALQVRSPFSHATALVSVEREGVIDAFVQEVRGELPVINVPVKTNYAPNVYVSVLLVRGRVGEIQPTALLDLGKPAMKLGIAELKVSRVPHTLQVKVATDKEIYRVREKALAKIIVQSADGSPLARDAEVTVAAIDEAVLELQDNDSWDLLEAMLRRRPYGVTTSSAQLQVIGKRHFGLKALPTGGGGGSHNTRELFDTLLLWKGTARLSSTGAAQVEIPLNDSLSRFRVVAIAASGASRFGTGSASFTTSQDLMVLPGIAPLAREGDLTTIEATLRNTTARTMTVLSALSGTRSLRSSAQSSAATAQSAVSAPVDIQQSTRTIILAPGASERLRWEVEVPVDTSAIQYQLSLKEQAGDGATDSVALSQQIELPVRPTILQATLQQVTEPLRIPVQAPADAVPGLGGISVAFRPSLLEGADGLRQFMRNYPYSCLEQRVSKAITLSDREAWSKITQELPAHLDGNFLLKYFPQMREGSVALTAYVVAISKAAGFEIPEDSRANLLAALTRVASGQIITPEVQSGSGNTTQLRIAALDAVSRWQSVDPALVAGLAAGREAADLRLLPTLSLTQWWGVVHRTAELPDREMLLERIKNEVLTRMNYQGTMMMLSSGDLDEAWWYMSSADRAIIELILAVLETSAPKTDSIYSDIPKMVRGALERQQSGAWSLTTANAWGSIMLRQYAAKFEREAVGGVSQAALSAEGAPAAAPFVTTRWDEYQPSKKRSPIPLSTTPFLNGPSVLELRHQGSGAPWAFVQSVASIPLKEQLASGYRITKELTAIEQATPGEWSEGDIIRVKLHIDAQADRNWTVIDDPIPAGATILGTNKRTSSIAQSSESESESEEDDNEYFNRWSWPVYIERSFGAFRAYYDYFPKGVTTLEYSIRVNAPGKFLLPPTRVEAMYSPEMFGELPNAPLPVAERSR